MECELCHDAAAGHNKIVPPEHDCAEWQEEAFCFDCDPDGYMAQWPEDFNGD